MIEPTKLENVHKKEPPNMTFFTQYAPIFHTLCIFYFFPSGREKGVRRASLYSTQLHLRFELQKGPAFDVEFHYIVRVLVWHIVTIA